MVIKSKYLNYFGYVLVVNFLLCPQIVKSQSITPDQLRPEQIPPPQDILPSNPPPPSESIKPLPPPEELLPSFSEPNTDSLPENIPGTITIEKFNFVGNTVFTQEELEAVTANFLNRPISFSELLQARTAVTEFYINQGYVTSGAYIPPQELDQPIVTIQIIEGELQEINISGIKRLDPNYIRSRINLGAKKPLNIPRLLEALQLLQFDPLIATISAELTAGTQPGTSILELQIKEARSFNIEGTFDNGRSPSVGTFRRGGAITEANLLGYGDGIDISYFNTDGSDDLGISYSFPMNPHNGKLNLQYRQTWSGIIEEPFDDLDGDGNTPDIKSQYQQYEVSFRQPVIQTPNQELALGIGIDHQYSKTEILGQAFPLSPGAGDDGITRITALRFFQEWTQRSEREVFAARSQFNLGIDAFQATMNSSSPDSSFFSWRGQAQWVRLLDQDFTILARTDLQLSDRPLVPLEQFSLGGMGSVRGYRQDALLSDNGWLASVELRIPLLRARKIGGVLHFIPFFDVGTTWNSGEGNEVDDRTLASVGLGLQWQIQDRLTARFDWGIPLIDIDGGDNTLQEQGFLFSLNFKLF